MCCSPPCYCQESLLSSPFFTPFSNSANLDCLTPAVLYRVRSCSDWRLKIYFSFKSLLTVMCNLRCVHFINLSLNIFNNCKKKSCSHSEQSLSFVINISDWSSVLLLIGDYGLVMMTVSDILIKITLILSILIVFASSNAVWLGRR